MNAGLIVGARIVKVTQSRFYDYGVNQMRVVVDTIELSNGVVLVPEHISYGDKDGFAQDAASVAVMKRHD